MFISKYNSLQKLKNRKQNIKFYRNLRNRKFKFWIAIDVLKATDILSRIYADCIWTYSPNIIIEYYLIDYSTNNLSLYVDYNRSTAFFYHKRRKKKSFLMLKIIYEAFI